jgi:hypothetical protein
VEGPITLVRIGVIANDEGITLYNEWLEAIELAIFSLANKLILRK